MNLLIENLVKLQSIELERARHVLAVDDGLEARAANQEALFVERQERAGVDLVLGRLAPHVPVGLQEAERSLNSTIQIDLDGIPLKTTLRLILKQLRLDYYVEDGSLVITSEDTAEKRMPPALRKKVEQAKRGELTSSEMKELIEVFKLRKELLRMTAEAPPGSNGDPTAELLNEVRQLVQILRAAKEGKKIPGGAGLQ